MEAAGIEPASEDIQQKVSTCLSRSFYLAARPLKGKAALKPASILFRLPGSVPTRLAILLSDAPRTPQELARETACLRIRQQVHKVPHLIGSTFLTR